MLPMAVCEMAVRRCEGCRLMFLGSQSTCATSQGKWDVPHFTAKAHVADYVREKHAGMISIFPSVAAFYTNFLEYARPKCATLSKSQFARDSMLRFC